MWQEFVSTATTANSLCCVLQVYYFSPKALLCFAFSLNQMLPSIASPDKELDSQMRSFCLLLFYVRFYHERQCQSLLWLLLYWALPLTTSPNKGLDSQMRRGTCIAPVTTPSNCCCHFKYRYKYKNTHKYEYKFEYSTWLEEGWVELHQWPSI